MLHTDQWPQSFPIKSYPSPHANETTTVTQNIQDDASFLPPNDLREFENNSTAVQKNPVPMNDVLHILIDRTIEREQLQQQGNSSSANSTIMKSATRLRSVLDQVQRQQNQTSPEDTISTKTRHTETNHTTNANQETQSELQYMNFTVSQDKEGAKGNESNQSQ